MSTAAGEGPALTVGMPVFNAAATIRESIDSVLAQDYRDFELIVSDNASTDGTAEIAQEYADRDERVRLVRHDQNRGGAANFSDLVGMARTPYFKWQSGDDTILPGHLSRCMQVLEADPGVVLAYCRTVMVDEDGEFWRNHEDRLHLTDPRPWKRLWDFALYRWLCNAQFGIIRTDVLRQTSLLQPKRSSDITLLAELAVRGRFHEVPDRLFVRRMTPDSAGLGELSKVEMARWLNPRAPRPQSNPALRVLWDVQVAILRAPLPPLQRLATLVAYDAARARRQVGIWRYRRRRRRAGLPRVTWDSLREKSTDPD